MGQDRHAAGFGNGGSIGVISGGKCPGHHQYGKFSGGQTDIPGFQFRKPVSRQVLADESPIPQRGIDRFGNESPVAGTAPAVFPEVGCQYPVGWHLSAETGSQNLSGTVIEQIQLCPEFFRSDTFFVVIFSHILYVQCCKCANNAFLWPLCKI